MAGYDNIKDHGFDKRTADERRELAIKAGKASGAVRRRKADFRKTLNMLLTAKIESEEWEPILKALGLECTLESALNMAMIKEGLSGNVKAYEAVAKYSGQSVQTELDLEEQRIRTDRSRAARDQEVGDVDNENENIRNFLKAMNPEPDDIEQLFAQEEAVDDAEETEEAGEI